MFIQFYEFVFEAKAPVPAASVPGTPPETLGFTHSIVYGCDYYYLSDTFQLMPISEVMHPVVMVPSFTSTSARDAIQFGVSTKRVSFGYNTLTPTIRPKFFMIHLPLGFKPKE